MTVTTRQFQHGLAQAAAQKGRKSAPKQGGNGYGKFKEIALGELLDFIWIEGQAAEMGIGVTRGQVKRELARLRKEAFKSRAEYHRFLKEAHYTRRDVFARVEVQMLSARIQERVAAGIRGQGARQKAFAKFVAEYNARWRARTACAPEYLIDRCSNAPAP